MFAASKTAQASAAAPAPTNDPYWPNVSLLLHGDGTNGAQNNTFNDSSNNAFVVTRNGNTTSGSYTPFSSLWSGYFDGSTSTAYQTFGAPSGLALGTGDFTIELWINPFKGGMVFDFRPAGTNGAYPFFALDTGTFYYWINFQDIRSSSYTVGQWYHIAISRSGTSTKMFVNGTQVGSTISDSNSYLVGANRPIIAGNGWLSPGTPATYFGGFYISNFRVVKGTAVYTSNFTVPTTPLTAVSGTSLLYYQSNRFVDNSSNNLALTYSGTPAISPYAPFTTGVSYDPGTSTEGSVYFDGSGDYITMPTTGPANLGTGDFTIDGWIYPTSSFYNYGIIFATQSSNSAGFLTVYYSSTGSIGIGIYDGSTRPATSGSTLTLNTWQHFAAQRSGNTFSLYLNGVKGTDFTYTSFNILSADPRIGQNPATSGERTTGYISNFRIVKGTALYSANFTPSSTPLTAVAGTSLLTCQSNGIVDNSGNNYTLTPVGDTRFAATTPFNPTAANSGSGYFDGSGDYLSVNTATALNISTGDFTIEFFVNPSSVSTGILLGLTDGNFIGSASQLTLAIYFTASTLVFRVYSSTSIYTVASPAASTGTWAHFALVRSGNVFTVYKNGTSAGSSTLAITLNYGTGWFWGIGSLIGDTQTGYLNGYLSNIRLVKGTAVYTSNFTAPTAPLTAISGTGLLTCQQDGLVDNSANHYNITPYGNAVATATSPFSATQTMFTTDGGSMYFDGSGDYLSGTTSTGIEFGTGNFTVEAWVYMTANATGNYNMIFASAGLNMYFGVVYVGTAPAYRLTAFDGTTVLEQSTGASFTLNTWTHVAWVRSGTTFTAYLNGTSVYSTTNSKNITGTTGFRVGSSPSYAGYMWNGYLSNIRIVKGTAVYVANFTPPATPLTTIANTSLLLLGNDGAIYDNAVQNDLETVGNAKISTSVVKYGTGSLAFDGTGDSLVPSTSNLGAFGTGDFTIELWVYFNTVASNQVLLDFRAATADIAPALYLGASAIKWYVSSADRITSSTVSATTWYHVAVTRSSGSTKLFINGTQSGSTYADTNAYVGKPARPWIGALADGTSPPLDLNGYIDDLRITPGIARYTSNFTPPTAAFPNY